jgi:hypothetical protein
MYIIKDTTHSLYFCTEIYNGVTVNYWHKDNTTAISYNTIEEAEYIIASLDYKDDCVMDIEPIDSDNIYEVDKEDTTCFHCKDKDICDYAYDAYNTEGDCLFNK